MPSSACHLHLRAPHPFPTRRSSDLPDLLRALRRDDLLAGEAGPVLSAPLLPRRPRRDPVRRPSRGRDRGALVARPQAAVPAGRLALRSEEHTSELQSPYDLVCRLLLATSTSAPHTLSLHDALPIFLTSYVRYVGMTFWPVKLAPFYPHRFYPDVPGAILSAVLLAAVTAALSWRARKQPYLLVGWL